MTGLSCEQMLRQSPDSAPLLTVPKSCELFDGDGDGGEEALSASMEGGVAEACLASSSPGGVSPPGEQQQLVRRAIEAHPHWWEVAKAWHAHSWAYRNGHAEYLPSLVGDLGSAAGSAAEWATMPMMRVLQAKAVK